jgi:CubicO group peptidase (beta-lactamase class C family)
VSGTTLTGPEFLAKLASLPLAYQPGKVWDYSLSVDVAGLVVEAASGKGLGNYLRERIWQPLGMTDTSFNIPAEKQNRYARWFPNDPETGKPQAVLDLTRPLKFECGGGCGASTAGDYLRFSQMMLNGGVLEGRRVLSRTTVRLMTSDHLGPSMGRAMDPGLLLLGTKGYTFGLGFMVREGEGIAGVPGTRGEFMWAGYAGTYFWVDPVEQVAAVLMTQAASPQRAYFRRLVKQLVYQAIAD